MIYINSAVQIFFHFLNRYKFSKSSFKTIFNVLFYEVWLTHINSPIEIPTLSVSLNNLAILFYLDQYYNKNKKHPIFEVLFYILIYFYGITILKSGLKVSKKPRYSLNLAISPVNFTFPDSISLSSVVSPI